jgi:hypothetical protein
MVAGEGATIMLENRAPKIFLGVFLAISVAPALAHDPSHPELFNNLSDRWADKALAGKKDRRRNGRAIVQLIAVRLRAALR